MNVVTAEENSFFIIFYADDHVVLVTYYHVVLFLVVLAVIKKLEKSRKITGLIINMKSKYTSVGKNVGWIVKYRLRCRLQGHKHLGIIFSKIRLEKGNYKEIYSPVETSEKILEI